MKHHLPIDKLGPTGRQMADAVQACVHCGFCLPTCPTYAPLGQEMDTPRGRITLMKETLEGTLPLEHALPHLDRCLGCLACETSCPSGVSYRDLVGPFREKAELERKRTLGKRFRRHFILGVLTQPRPFALLAKLAFLGQPFKKWLPKRVRAMLELLPERLPPKTKLPERAHPEGKSRACVALVKGCAQHVLEPEINLATISVLVRNGLEVIVPRKQNCCGALHWHAGEGERARTFARTNLDAFPHNVAAVISNAAGCGSCLKEYPFILKGDARENEALSLSSLVCDLSVFLDNLGFKVPPTDPVTLRVVYQDACHLRHAQGVTDAPRRILQAIPGVNLVEIADPEICCGSAGIYNIEHPEIATELGRCKVDNILAAKPDLVVSANIGCLAQLRRHMSQRLIRPPVLHLAVALEKAYAGTLGSLVAARAS